MSVDIDVLVVGAGPVGLALAIELGTRGVRVLVAERSARAGSAPRAKTTNVRTRTHLRRWGLADRLAEASPLGISYPNDVMFVTRLAEHRLAYFKDAFNAAPERSPLYPEHAQWIPQYTLEKLLREHAQSLPTVELRFDATFHSTEQDGDTVVSVLENEAGEQSRVSSHYLVGADGARSTVRGVIGAKMEGRYGLSRNYNIVFRAPGMPQSHPHGRAVMYWQTSSHGASLIGPMDRDDVWFFMPTGMKDGETLSNDQAAQAIALATGIDLPYEILSTDEWIASRLLADRYRKGSIFLAGDACHLHAPFGGYGMNMGVGDGVDLGWKIAANLQGWGGPALLDSYEIERRPLHEAVMEEATANHALLGSQLYREGLDDDTPEGEALRTEVGALIQSTKGREFHTLGTVLGLAYEVSPIIAHEDGPAPEHTGQVYRPNARPGSLAPHAWLSDGRSIYDLFGQGFALIVSDLADKVEVAAAESQARALRIPLTVVRPEGVDVAKLYEADLVLVRPDQHIAWRGDRWSDDILPLAAGLATAGANRSARP
jgi:2-polyprenyl-6-methoxyphenol hydroxylase-like FAD-dependent oxidoreductase